MMQVVKTKGITPVWAFLIMLSAFPVAGMICAVYYHNSSIFYEALIAVPIAAVAGPIAILSLFPLIQWLHSRVLGFVLPSTVGRFSATIIFRTLFALGVVAMTALAFFFSWLG
jgi:hypothetical protein